MEPLQPLRAALQPFARRLGRLVNPLQLKKPRLRRLPQLTGRLLHHRRPHKRPRELLNLQKPEKLLRLPPPQRKPQPRLPRLEQPPLQRRLRRLRLRRLVGPLASLFGELRQQKAQLLHLPLRNSPKARLRPLRPLKQLFEDFAWKLVIGSYGGSSGGNSGTHSPG